MSRKVAIIGSGISGLAASVRLSAAGMDVHVYESASSPGGKIHIRQADGYRFDGGPSLFTQPQYIEELFSLAGVDPSDHFKYWQIDESCRYFWDDDTVFHAYHDQDQLDSELSEIFPEDKEHFLKYLNDSQKKYERVGKIFLEKAIHRPVEWFDKNVFKAFLHLGSYGIFKSLHDENEKRFSSSKLQQLFDRYATYNGSDPYRTSAMMSMIPHFEMNEGTFLPKGGMYEIANSIYHLAQSMGVTFHFDSIVEEIRMDKMKAIGIKVGGDLIKSDVVVSAIDVKNTYKHLLKSKKIPEKIKSQEPSSSAIIFYWGINKEFKELGLHNIFFSNDYEKEFQCIEDGTLYDDPTVYINITSKYIPGDAPQGCENWFVMINAPFDKGQDWVRLTEFCRQRTIRKIQSILGVNIQEFIEVEDIWTPPGIEQQTSSFGGSLYGSSSNDLFAAFNRHPNAHPKIQNLFFCGGSVHPGGGIPLCLQSAKITSHEILNR